MLKYSSKLLRTSQLSQLLHHHHNINTTHTNTSLTLTNIQLCKVSFSSASKPRCAPSVLSVPPIHSSNTITNNAHMTTSSAAAANINTNDAKNDSHKSTMKSQDDAVHMTATVVPSSKSRVDFALLSDEDVISSINNGTLKFFSLEKDLADPLRAVRIRRAIIEQRTSQSLSSLPYEHYDYSKVAGQCCENVIGTVPIPVGVAGPILIDGKEYYPPMATTEGALVASTTRGCKALTLSGGVNTELIGDSMCRAPVLSCTSAKVANSIKKYTEEHFDEIANDFNSTSRFARLQSIDCYIAGRKLFMRFAAKTGDGMGMNMVGKGTERAVTALCNKFEGVSLLSLSGNVCTDKKPSAINWVNGRGKSVVCEAIVKKSVVESVLKTTVDAIIEVNYAKNLVGSAVAGSIGGQNAHASNIVTAMFIATGQDPAQNVESSNCMTLMEKEGEDLYVSVTMPSLEVGTIGGGTILPGQHAMLTLLGVNGTGSTPGVNSAQLARVIGSTVLAGELSLMAALSSGHLISSHMKLNRKSGH